MDTTDTEHRTGDTGISSNRRPGGSTGTGRAAGKGALGVARARVQWPSAAKTAALRTRNLRVGGQGKVGEDDVGAGDSAMVKDRGARVARRDRRGTCGERGPLPGRQAQRAGMERGARVPSPVGARGHESV